MLAEIFLSFLKLGVTAFGGPAAHLSLFRQEFVERRGWLTDTQYSELVTISQILPGPASSQVGFCLGIYRGGWLGGLLAFTAFTLPSILLLLLFASISSQLLTHSISQLLIYTLKILAVLIVSQALWGMIKSFCNDRHTIFLGGCSLTIMSIVNWQFTGLAIIAFGLIFGFVFLNSHSQDKQSAPLSFSISKKQGAFFLFLCVLLLLLLPLITPFSTFYTAGALVFGGGHVVLPLLQTPLVDSGVINIESFMAGYGATQLVPGPIFTFASYLGFISPLEIFTRSPLLNAAIATIFIFTPGFLLVIGTLPFWQSINQHTSVRGALKGASAVVVGILAAALINPMMMSVIPNLPTLICCIIAIVLVIRYKLSLTLTLLLSAIISLFSHAILNW